MLMENEYTYLFFKINTIRTPEVTRRQDNLEYCCTTSVQEKEEETGLAKF